MIFLHFLDHDPITGDTRAKALPTQAQQAILDEFKNSAELLQLQSALAFWFQIDHLGRAVPECERWPQLNSIPSVYLKNMRTKLKLLITVASAGLLLPGCCSPHHVSKWEYKVVTPTINTNGKSIEENLRARQQVLNDLGKDGWILVSQAEGGIFSAGGVFYLKRPMR
jgi:hypothetical protein